jgi:amidophosphoribosyltransferase
VVDDSIVRGNTQRALVRMLREAGAAEIHVRISSPPIKWPCFYGIDFANRAELIANGLAVDDIRASLGADSLGYISEDGMIEATRQEPSELCTACFSGRYPTELPAADALGKSVVEARRVAAAPHGRSEAAAEAREEETVEEASGERIQLAEDAEISSEVGSCDPGPDAELEDLVLERDTRTSDEHSTSQG